MTRALAPILLATRSAGKLRELRPLFEARGRSVIDLSEAGLDERPEEESLECHPTFEANALAKARHFFARSGRPTVADDSGLEVAALRGAPGVLSKRWSGRTDLTGQALDDENNRKLLGALEATGANDRRARYVCAAAFVDAEGDLMRRGVVEGEVTSEARGAGGFGYDPFFFSTELACTFGQASVEEKEEVSHRGRAFRALLNELERARGR